MKKIVLLVCLICFAFIGCSKEIEREVKIGWDADEYFNYYVVYYGKSSGKYTEQTKRIYGNETVIKLNDKDTYYFNMVGCIISGKEEVECSGFTNEVVSVWDENSK